MILNHNYRIAAPAHDRVTAIPEYKRSDRRYFSLAIEAVQASTGTVSGDIGHYGLGRADMILRNLQVGALIIAETIGLPSMSVRVVDRGQQSP